MCIRDRYYMYSYAAHGTKTAGDDFRATANGDLNGDGVMSSFWVVGNVGEKVVEGRSPEEESGVGRQPNAAYGQTPSAFPPGWNADPTGARRLGRLLERREPFGRGQLASGA